MSNWIYLRSPTTGEELPGARLPDIGDMIKLKVGYVMEDLVTSFHTRDEVFFGMVIKNDQGDLAMFMAPPPNKENGDPGDAPPWPSFNEIVCWSK